MFIGVWLLYNIMLVSATQQSESAIWIHISLKASLIKVLSLSPGGPANICFPNIYSFGSSCKLPASPLKSQTPTLVLSQITHKPQLPN